MESLSVEIQYLSSSGSHDNRHIPKPAKLKQQATKVEPPVEEEEEEEEDEDDDDDDDGYEYEIPYGNYQDNDVPETKCDDDPGDPDDPFAPFRIDKDMVETVPASYYDEEEIIEYESEEDEEEDPEPELEVTPLEEENDMDVLQESYTDIEIVKMNPGK